MQALLTVIATWLSVNFGLPVTYEHPRVEFVTVARMAEVRHERLAEKRDGAVGAARHASEGGNDVFGVYDDAGRTIYLPEDWDATEPADSSLLVHEMVHHLQNVAGAGFACAGEREKDAYRAQRAWLTLFGRTLEQDFELDPLTILVRTNCMH